MFLWDVGNDDQQRGTDSGCSGHTFPVKKMRVVRPGKEKVSCRSDISLWMYLLQGRETGAIMRGRQGRLQSGRGVTPAWLYIAFSGHCPEGAVYISSG